MDGSFDAIDDERTAEERYGSLPAPDGRDPALGQALRHPMRARAQPHRPGVRGRSISVQERFYEKSPVVAYRYLVGACHGAEGKRAIDMGKALVATVEVFDTYLRLNTHRVDRQQHDVGAAAEEGIGDHPDLTRERAMDEALAFE